MKNFVMVLLLSAAVNAVAAPGAVNRPKPETIEEYIRITEMQQIVDASLVAYDQQLFSQLPLEERLRAKRQMEDIAGWAAVRSEVIQLIGDTYTEEELRAYISFVKTPLGASGTAKGQVFSRKMGEIVVRNIQRLMSGQ